MEYKKEIYQYLCEIESSDPPDNKMLLLVSSILDSFPHAVLGLKNRRIIFVNKAVEKVFGWSPEELIGSSTRRLYVSEGENEVIEKYCYPIIEEQGTYFGEFPCRKKDGTDITCMLSIARIGSTLKDKMIIATYVDITSEKKAIEDAVNAKRHFISMLDNVPDMAWLKDRDGRFIAVNKPFGESCALKPEDILGKTDIDILPEDLARAYMDDDFDVMTSRKVKRIEGVLTDAAGKRKWIETIKTPILDEQGGVAGITGIARDITERKEAEEFLRRSKDDLEQIVSERTKVLEETVRKLKEEIYRRKQAEKALRNRERQYKALSIMDGLTELYNARHFFSLLDNEIRRAERYKHPLSMLLLDVDNFKKYNDSFGHLEGDKVLVRLADVIRRNLRSTDSAGRYGGEEFVVILPETAGHSGAQIAERIRTDFGKEVFLPEGGKEIHVTVSVGISQFSSGEDAASFIKEADANMYRAKKEGKDRICFQSSTSIERLSPHPKHSSI